MSEEQPHVALKILFYSLESYFRLTTRHSLSFHFIETKQVFEVSPKWLIAFVVISNRIFVFRAYQQYLCCSSASMRFKLRNGPSDCDDNPSRF